MGAGFRAKKDIAFREAYLSVPLKCLMSIGKAMKHPVLRVIIDQNPELFDEEQNTEYEQMTLALFLMYEIGRGKQSYWYPYLVSMPTVRFSCFWSHEEIMQIQDKAILERMIEYRKSLRKEWKDFSLILKKNYKVFPLNIINEGLFYNVYA